MENDIKREIEKIKLPDELHMRAKLGIQQVKQKKKWWKSYQKWTIAAVASLLLIGTTYSLGGSPFIYATETLVKIFKPDELTQSQEDIQNILADFEVESEELEGALKQMNQHLELAKEHLSPEEFVEYSQLIVESMKINAELIGNPNADLGKLEKKALELRSEILKYGIYELTIHTVEEARAMASYPINYPSYVPDGYQLIEEEARTEEYDALRNPIVIFHYHQIEGEFNFYTVIQKINQTQGKELSFYEHIDSYQLNGYTFEHAYDNSTNVQDMRIMIPDEGYEIIITASILSKEEMERILLSMVDAPKSSKLQ